MIHAHVTLYSRLTPPQSLALWDHLYQSGLVSDPPDPRAASGDTLASKCSEISHAEVVMSIADKSTKFWCDVLDLLLQKPVYLCARGETGIPLTDLSGRPLPLPIGHRRGEAAGTGGMPKRVATRVQYQRKHDPRVIVKLVEKNPKIPNSKSYARFQIYRLGMTVSEYVALGGYPADIVNDVSKGYIVVDIV